MRDWGNEVSRRLADSRLSTEERDEIARELAGHLEDLCDAAYSNGQDEDTATQRATAELHEDKYLGAHLYRARKENAMNLNDRTKRLWLPGMSMFFASAALLAASQAAALWTYHAFAPAPHAENYPQLVHDFMRHDGAPAAAALCKSPRDFFL